MALNYTTRLKYLSLSALGIALVLFFAVNMFSNVALKSWRLDLTENNVYTLSDGTKRILSQVNEPIQLKLYFSRKLTEGSGNIISYANRVTELLEEYQRLSNGKVQLSVIDPEPFSEAEDIAIGYGLHGITIDEAGSTFYFGLVASNSLDNEKTIRFFQQDREPYLEYDITQLVYELGKTDKPILGLISTLPLEGQGGHSPYYGGSKPWTVYEQLSEMYQIEQIDPTVYQIPEDVDVLALVNPRELTDETIYAVDQFVLKGGHLLAFLDGYSETGTQEKIISADDEVQINKLLEKWGVQFVGHQIVADKVGAKEVWYNDGGRQALMRFPIWMDVSQSQINQADYVTNNIDKVTLATPGYFTTTGIDGVEITPLLQSSNEAMLIQPEAISSYQSNPAMLSQNFQATGDTYLFAIRVSGNLQSAFDTQPDFVNEADKQTHLKSAKQSGNIILVSDSDFLNDQYWIQEQALFGQNISIPLAANGQFALNAVDNLSGSNDLISVRSRGQFTRPFTYLESIKAKAEAKFQDTEQDLMAQLRDTEEQLAALADHKVEGNQLILSSGQQAAIENFRKEQVKIRKALRKVKHELQRELDDITDRIKFVNIGAMPLLVGLTGIGFSVLRRRRSKKQTPKENNHVE